MPQGADAEDLANLSRFRKYISANAESWYRHVNNIRGREARNGDIRLVVGCDKASSWGMATFTNSTAQDFHLEFKRTGESGSRPVYSWDYSGMVEPRAGPDPEATEELRSGDDSGQSGVYKNQCLFIRTLNATFRDEIWLRLGLETAVDIECNLDPNFYIPSSSIGPSTTSASPTGGSYSNSATREGNTFSAGILSLPQKPLPSIHVADFNFAPVSFVFDNLSCKTFVDNFKIAHPSREMNDFMLTAVSS
jgi:hypothetical protein